ncbi:hypothetical protein HanRHA438_Chr02g0067391 [Helianthus annuus]|nr:hypothetical protein HanRHA438_Chr02g0067391 [Helianthus annuus]
MFFKAVMKKLPLPYPPSFEYISIPVGKSATSRSYKDLIDRFFKISRTDRDRESMTV